MPGSANSARPRQRARSAPPDGSGSGDSSPGKASTGQASTGQASTGQASQPDYRVEALAKGLRVLSVFSERRPTWRITDIATEVSLPLPTAYRIVMTLT